MHRRFLIILFILFYTTLNIQSFNLRLVEQWKHDELIAGFYFNGLFYNDKLILMFFKSGVKVIDKKEISNFAQLGQGPDDIFQGISLAKYKDKVADIEGLNRIKIFKRIKNKYRCIQNVWLEKPKHSCVFKYGLFNKKWFFSGVVFESRKINPYSVIKIYEENGKHIKDLNFKGLKNKEKKRSYLHLMKSYLGIIKNKLFFLREDKLEVTFVSLENFNIEQTLSLQKPVFYKEIPDNFYNKDKSKKVFSMSYWKKLYAKWATSYSRITNVATYKNNLIIQIRSCNDKKKTFALLFYKYPFIKIEKIIFTDDLLLTTNKNKFYFFKDGDPSLDENAGDVIINIYRLEN